MVVLDKSNLIFYLVLISIVCFLVFIDFSFVNDFIFYIVFFNNFYSIFSFLWYRKPIKFYIKFFNCVFIIHNI